MGILKFYSLVQRYDASSLPQFFIYFRLEEFEYDLNINRINLLKDLVE